MHVVKCRLRTDEVTVQCRRSDAVSGQRIEHRRHLGGEDGEIARGDGAIRADELNIDRRAVAERGSNGPAVQRHGSGNQDDGHLHDCTLRTAPQSERVEHECGIDRPEASRRFPEREGRARRQARHHADVDGRRHPQHRLRAGRGRPEVINLTRFPFFFPEKREFFLESSGQFDLGTRGRVQLFYSRRIYGRLGPWKLGAFDAQTGGADDANNAVLRLQRDLFDRSYIGAIGTMRAGPNGQGVRRAGGLDIDLPLVVHGANLEPKVWIAGSQTPGVPGTPLAWRISTDNPNDLFDNFVSLYRIDSGFAPPLGFVRRTEIWEATGHVDFTPRPGVLGIRQLDFTFPIPSWDVIANENGSLFRSSDWQNAWFEWRVLGGDLHNGDHFEVNFQRLMDAPTDTFEIFRGVVIPPARYWWSRYELQYFMNAGRPLSVGAFANWGRFYGGHSTDLELSAAWRGGGHVIVSADLIRTRATLPAGGFTAVVSATRFEYDLDPRTSLLAFVQYDNENERVDFNVRFHWIPMIGDDVFLVWNSGYTTDRFAQFRFPDTRALTRPLNGAVVIKLVHRLTP